MHEEGCSFLNREMKMHSLMHLLSKSSCDVVLLLAKFVIWSGGYPSIHECTEMQLKFQDSRNLSVFLSTPKVGGIGLNLTPANHAVIGLNFWVLNVQREAFARVAWLGQIRVPLTWSQNTGPGGYDNHASDLHRYSGVAQVQDLHGLVRRLNILMSMTYRMLGSHEDDSMWLTENGDTLQSDEPFILDC